MPEFRRKHHAGISTESITLNLGGTSGWTEDGIIFWSPARNDVDMNHGTYLAPHVNRIAIVGAGHVGATTAYALMLRAVVGEIVLIDRDVNLARAQALDLEHANALSRPARIRAGDYADAATASIAIVTAGATTKPGESRLAVLERSATIVRECVGALTAVGFRGVILVTANPVDIMTRIAHELSGFAAARVIGSGTVLDSARFRSIVGDALGLDPRSIHGYVLGEHGDSEIAAFSIAQVGLLPLREYVSSAGSLDEIRIQDDVRNAGYQIIDGKGFTSFGVASAVVRICEAIIWDEHAVLPVSCRAAGEYGISDVYMSLPCVIGSAGIERSIAPHLSGAEVEGLHASADILRETYARLGPSRDA